MWPAARSVFLAVLLSAPGGCGGGTPPSPPASEGGWLHGSVEEKFDTVAKQLRGFDMAMFETGHRYTELYWAGHDENWGYAEYQVKKVRTAVQNGLERRPKRAASAETFLKVVLPAVEAAVAKRDPAGFRASFGTLTSTCNACHEQESVSFVKIAPPEVRLSPVRAADPTGGKR